jgi:integrase
MLTDREIKSLQVREKIYRVHDALGLFLEIPPKGSKRWRFKYFWEGKEKRMSFGLYPEISLKQARTLRDAAREKIREKIDPSNKEGSEREIILFSDIAEEFKAKNVAGWSDGHLSTITGRLNLYIFPFIGNKILSTIKPSDILQMLEFVESRGLKETASRILGICSQIFRYAVCHGYLESDPCRDLRGALSSVKAKPMAALTDGKRICELLQAMQQYSGTYVVQCAVQLTALTFVRQGELRFAQWDEINWENRWWEIPKERMKMGREHLVPLSRQALTLLENLRLFTGAKKFIFSSVKEKPLSENAVLKALRVMGFSAEEMTAHGFRAMASTILYESGKWRSVVIERQLAHMERNEVKAAYNRAEYLTERKNMMQWYADYLDALVST